MVSLVHKHILYWSAAGGTAQDTAWWGRVVLTGPSDLHPKHHLGTSQACAFLGPTQSY